MKKESSRQPTGFMSRGSEDESLTANTEHTAFLCLYYHIPQIKSTDFKRSQKIRRGAAVGGCFRKQAFLLVRGARTDRFDALKGRQNKN